ncbi:MAG TPA: diguanylate cyclase, partial [Actinomycetales bacterium]
MSTVSRTPAQGEPNAGPRPLDPAAAGLWWDHSPCAQLVLDAAGGIVLEANQTFLQWSGLDRSTVVGTEFARLLPVGDRILWSTHCLPKLETSGRVDEVSVQVVGAERERRAAFLTARRLPTVDAATGAAHVSVALFAATERRRYEEDLLGAKRRAEESESRRASAEEGLHHLAHHDPVTGLLNRRGLRSALELASSGEPADARPGAGAVVLFIDIDGFKAVNDSVGHAGGDELLITIAQRLRDGVRRSAAVARFAGDEFVVVDHLPARGDVEALCRRLLQMLAEPALVRGVEVVLTASIGVALVDDDLAGVTADPQAGADVLLHRADAAMYQVKSGGGGGWRVHDPRVADAAADRLQLLEQLRHAVGAGELRLHYQPRVRLADGAVTGVEALVRWQHPTRGLLGPVEFIDVAEASGVIRDLGAWVLRTAMAQAAAWRARGHRVQMSVNISARQLVDPELLQVVTDAL